MSTFISGVASCESIDTASEIVSIKGLDITSLACTGTITWEHNMGRDAAGKAIGINLPSQVVGKIIEAKKILTSSDCSSENQTHFWNKTKLPFVYIIAELLDDYTSSAKEVAGMFKYSKDHPDQKSILGFSIEGSEIPGTRAGLVITKSIARKTTLTCSPANHMCIAEIYDANQESKVKDDFEDIFKSEANAIEMLKSDEGVSVYEAYFAKKEIDFKNTPKFGPISSVAKMPGIPIGQTKSGKDVMSHLKPQDYKGWSSQDHRDAGNIHYTNAEEGKGVPGATHFDSAKRHLAFANKSEPMAKAEPSLKKDGNMAASPPEAKPADAQAMQNGGTSGSTSFGQAMSNLSSGLGFGKKEKGKQKPLNKALTAGSTNAAPSTLVNGAAYQVEGLSSKQATTGAEDHNFQGTKKKTDWNKRAKQDYENWPHKEKFESFMKARMPQLHEGEIRAIGKCIALNKSLGFEKFLGSLVKSEELDTKTIEQIQKETAEKWADRAETAYRKAIEEKSVKWLMDAIEYGHESIEHSALGEDLAVFEKIRARLMPIHKEACDLLISEKKD